MTNSDMLTSAIASPIWTNLSTKPMTVSMADEVDRCEDPAASCTKDSRKAWSRIGSVTDDEPIGFRESPSFNPQGAQEMMTMPP